MKCIYCEHPYTYALNNHQRKCSKCKRKFSLLKLARIERLHKLFLAEGVAKEVSALTGMHIATVLKYYAVFRRELALICDKAYQQNSQKVTDYDEYLYLPKSLDPNLHIAKVKHFLTLAYEGKVYNLMMPSIQRLGLNPENRDEKKLLEKYLRYDNISKLSTQRGTIYQFWDYFENFIVRFKGISDEQFAFYLKEAEWRFNTRLN